MMIRNQRRQIKKRIKLIVIIRFKLINWMNNQRYIKQFRIPLKKNENLNHQQIMQLQENLKNAKLEIEQNIKKYISLEFQFSDVQSCQQKQIKTLQDEFNNQNKEHQSQIKQYQNQIDNMQSEIEKFQVQLQKSEQKYQQLQDVQLDQNKQHRIDTNEELNTIRKMQNQLNQKDFSILESQYKDSIKNYEMLKQQLDELNIYSSREINELNKDIQQKVQRIKQIWVDIQCIFKRIFKHAKNKFLMPLQQKKIKQLLTNEFEERISYIQTISISSQLSISKFN
ncbi:unnamed protein product [Paramecium primaurelia]|uniref:Uncharacterized protein n=1 Tax=Paramecium primaurelia TaxID=5886 RepID=A0A8S1JXZ2_PARPR|nr:unnamed protein product [Paramecium primaurelia]